MANKVTPLAEVQITVPSQTAGQDRIHLLASIWFPPGEIHVDDRKITYGFVRATLEINDTLDSQYERHAEHIFGHINLRDAHTLQHKKGSGIIGNFSAALPDIMKIDVSGTASRETTRVKSTEEELKIPLYTLQSMGSRSWMMFGIENPTQLLNGRVVHIIDDPLIIITPKYRANPNEVSRNICISAEVHASISDHKTIISNGKSGETDANAHEEQAVINAIIARSIRRGKRQYDADGQPIPMLLARGDCNSKLGVPQS